MGWHGIRWDGIKWDEMRLDEQNEGFQTPRRNAQANRFISAMSSNLIVRMVSKPGRRGAKRG
eukprot:scaffold556531_cov14-Prasinocladus_malaysianus.AAC.1